MAKGFSMSASITINNQSFINQLATTGRKTEEKPNHSSFNNIVENVPAKANSATGVNTLGGITHIKKSDVEAIYNEIKQAVKKELNAENNEDREITTYDYLEGNIDKIMNYPIEVKIESDEVYQAMIYSRLGINYLDVKKVEVRMGLLELAEGDIKASEKMAAIRTDEAQVLYKKIEANQSKLAEEKQNLLDNKQLKEGQKHLFEQLTMTSKFV